MRALCVLLLFGATAAWPQQPARSSAKANAFSQIRVVGSHRFTGEQLVKAAGITIGEEATDDSMKRAAERLASSGMFNNVTYRYIAGPQGTSVEYQVDDVDKLLPPYFDNFVWLSEPELIQQLESLEPLFTGGIPNAGEMFQHLAENMKTVLSRLNIKGDVKVFPKVPQQGGDIVGFVYKVEGVSVPIRSVQFAGASENMNSVLQRLVTESLRSKDYSESMIAAVARLNFLPQYQQRGFLRASFGTPSATVLEKSTNEVAVTIPVEEGRVYRLSGLRWSGNTAYPASELVKFVKVAIGQPANQIELEENLGGISKIYGTKGYLSARLQPHFSFDDATANVAVDVEVREGDQYHMGNVYFDGLSPSSSEQLAKLWQLPTGSVYDTSYPNLFFQGASQRFNFGGVNIRYEIKPREEAKVVDVTIHFAAK